MKGNEQSLNKTEGESKMKFEEMVITPEIAEEMLKHNTNNRSPRTSWVSALASDMKEGNWELTPTPIVFLKDGTLLDGQQRLMAVVKSGVACKFMVCTNAEPTMSIDNGIKRSMRDQLMMGDSALKGDYISPLTLSTVRMIMQIKTSKFHCTSHQVESFIVENIETINDLIECTKKDQIRGIAIAPVHAAIFTALKNGVDKAKVASFYAVLSSGYQESKNDKMIVIHRNWLQQYGGTRNHSDAVAKYNRTLEVIRLMSIGTPKLRVAVPASSPFAIA